MVASAATTAASRDDEPRREAARRQLTFRCDDVSRQLARCGLSARRLGDLELAQLYLACWSPERARAQRFRQQLDDYTTLAVRAARVAARGGRSACSVCRRRQPDASRSAACPIRNAASRSALARSPTCWRRRRSRSRATMCAWNTSTRACWSSSAIRAPSARLAHAAARVRAPDRGQPARASAGDRQHCQTAQPQAGPAAVLAAGRRARRAAGRPRARGRLRGRRAAARRAPAWRGARLLGQPVRAAARGLPTRARRPDAPRRDHAGRHAGALARRHPRAGARLSRLPADGARRAAGLPQPGHQLAGDDVPVHLQLAVDGARRPVRRRDRARSRRSSSIRSTPAWRTPTWPSSPWPAPASATSSSSWRCATCWPASTSWSSTPRTSTARVCQAAGGQYVRLASTSAHHLNPFDLPPDGSRRGRARRDVLAEQVTAVLGLLDVMLAEPGRRLNPYERAVLDRARLPDVRSARDHAPIRPRTPARRRCCATCRRSLESRPTTTWRPGSPRACGATSAARWPAACSPGRPTSRSTGGWSSSTSSAGGGAAPAGDAPDRQFRLEPGAARAATAAAGHRRGLVAAALPGGRRVRLGHGPPRAQVLPGAGHHHPGRRRLPALRPRAGGAGQRGDEAAAEAGRDDGRGRRRGVPAHPGGAPVPARRQQRRGAALRARRAPGADHRGQSGRAPLATTAPRELAELADARRHATRQRSACMRAGA